LSPRGFDLSYDLSPPKDGTSYTRQTLKVNESWNVNNISRITGAKMDSSSNFIDDSKMMDLLNNDNDNIFEEIDMG